MFSAFERNLYASKTRCDFHLQEALSLWIEAPNNVYHAMEEACACCESFKNLDEAIADAVGNGPMELNLEEIKIAHSLYDKYKLVRSKILQTQIAKVEIEHDLLRTLPYQQVNEYQLMKAAEETVTRDELEAIAKSLGDYPRFLFPNGFNEDGTPIKCTSSFLDPSSANRLNTMIEAANTFWAQRTKGDSVPTNKEVALWIEENVSVSTTMADNMASIIRPDWAKDRTWKDNKKR